MTGFGEPEKKYKDKISWLKVADDSTTKDQMSKDIMLACDRNLDQKLNFNE